MLLITSKVRLVIADGVLVLTDRAQGLNLSFGYISAKTFPLPTLGPQLRKLSHELHHGRGFFVLRTIPVESYSREDNVLLYAGVSSYIANVRGLQDKNGGVLSHIKDLTKVVDNNTIGGPAYTTDKQVFHTDSGDVVSLFALEIAAEGGTSRISSAWRVYNELAEKRPDLIRTLSEPWPVDGFGYSFKSLDCLLMRKIPVLAKIRRTHCVHCYSITKGKQ